MTGTGVRVSEDVGVDGEIGGEVGVGPGSGDASPVHAPSARQTATSVRATAVRRGMAPIAGSGPAERVAMMPDCYGPRVPVVSALTVFPVKSFAGVAALEHDGRRRRGRAATGAGCSSTTTG